MRNNQATLRKGKIMRFTSIDEIRAANKAAGQHWFAPSTLRFFSSRIGGTVYGGKFFLTSERGPDNVRRHTVRVARADGTIGSATKFQAYASRSGAVRRAQKLATQYPFGLPYIAPVDNDTDD
jgi:hypothetical protein